ncbi:MAG: hypothetical protein WAZ48_09095 [Lysobacteraceae bacterium]
MADASRSPNPSGWSDVFAALPLEAPPASAWPAIAAQLHHKKTQARKRTWMALAASLFALMLSPAAWMLRDAERDPAIVATSPDTIARTPNAVPSATIVADDPGVDPSSIASPANHSADHSSKTLSIAANATRPAHARNARRSADHAQPRTTPALSAADIPQAQDDTGTTLETLYTASAQLETLLSFARDTRVESGPAAALASAFDAELATIDAQLAQPGLAVGEQRALWRARVDTLQRSAGFESNLRLLAADGGRLDGALVSID